MLERKKEYCVCVVRRGGGGGGDYQWAGCVFVVMGAFCGGVRCWVIGLTRE